MEVCDSPVAPYLSGNYEYEIRYGDIAVGISDTLILYGEGAYLGIFQRLITMLSSQ